MAIPANQYCERIKTEDLIEFVPALVKNKIKFRVLYPDIKQVEIAEVLLIVPVVQKKRLIDTIVSFIRTRPTNALRITEGDIP